MQDAKTISLFSQVGFTREQRRGHSAGAFMGLFTGLGLSIFQSVTHTWLLAFLPTSLTLFFCASGLFLLSKIGWGGILAPLESTDFNPLKSCALGLVWVIALCVYLQSSFLGRVLEQVPNLRAYNADPVCSSGAMYKLAKTPPQATPVNFFPPAPSAGVCRVGWVQAERNGPLAEPPYVFHFPNRDFFNVHKGDMLVVQTAFGHRSAVLYPSRSFPNSIFFPRGRILETRSHPVREFEGPFMLNFWFLFFFLFIGSLIVLRLLALFRN